MMQDVRATVASRHWQSPMAAVLEMLNKSLVCHPIAVTAA